MANAAHDEQLLAEALPPEERQQLGAFFTPAWLVQSALALALPYLPKRRLAFIDPACGAGAFLAGARERFPSAPLFGLERSAQFADACRARLKGATLHVGDALTSDLGRLLASVPDDAYEVWLGNPPYNGTSVVLGDVARYGQLRSLLGESLPAGTSLRDDYAFFILRAYERLRQKRGLLCFVTSATLLDAFLYSPLRKALLDALELCEVLDLREGAFRGTRVRTCVTVWRSATRQRSAVFFRARRDGNDEAPHRAPSVSFVPTAPELLLRPPSADADRLDRLWFSEGERLPALVPVSFPGLKTRFDELLVDASADRLAARIEELLTTSPSSLEAFARKHAIPARCLPKLRALRVDTDIRFDREAIRPYYRYAGARHRGDIPESARAYCYLDRRLIPRGDHRLQGDYDPHLGEVKLVFNARELPLCAAVLDRPGCVHNHRHTRFAPLWVPERILREGPAAARRGVELGPLVMNLSEKGRAWAEQLGGPTHAFRAIAEFINSEQVQSIWAPVFGTSRELPVPLRCTRSDGGGTTRHPSPPRG